MSEKYFEHRHMEKWTSGANEALVQEFIKDTLLFSDKIKVAAALKEFSKLMEPFDRTLGQDEEMLHSKAFFKGLMAGIGFAREAVEDDKLFNNLKRTILRALPAGVDIKDAGNAEFLYEFSEMVIASGHRTVDSFPALGAILGDEFIDFLEPSVRHQYYARAGVGTGYGIAMQHIYGHLPQPKTVEQLANDAQSDDFDWDSALEELSGSKC
jgi:hypothetical protein